MICTECGYQCKGVVCPKCRERRCYNGMILHQRRFIETWMEGNIELHYAIRDLLQHLVLFDDRWHTYCGLDLFHVLARDYSAEIPADLCPQCRTILEELIQRVKQEGNYELS